MPVYKRSSYDLFIHMVLLPNIRTIFLVLAAIALGCGSWLETNSSNDCGFQSTMSVFEVSIYQNISDPYALTPSSVSFGLWKHCFYYAQNCTCTPISLTYEIDADQSIFAATNNQTMPTIDASHSSYIRLIPLIMALVLSAASLGFSFWGNRTVSRPLFFWINGAVSLIAAVLVSLAFGYTYQTYRSAIFNACQVVNHQSVRCASLAPKLEVILLAVALGLLVLASALFGCVRASDTDTSAEVYIDEKTPSRRQSTFLQAIQRNSKLMSSSHLSQVSTASKEPAMYGVDESLDAWRDVAILDGHHYQQEQQMNNPLRPPPATGRRSNEYAYKNQNTNGYDRRYSSTPRAYPTTSSPTNYTSNGNEKRRRKHGSTSSGPQHHPHYEMSNLSDDLLPPTLPFADPQQRRKNSAQQAGNQPRPTSHASGNTFGAHDMLLEESPSSSAFTLDDHHHPHGGRQYSDASFRTATPTSYHYDRSDSHDSICFTPTFNDRSSSGISIASQIQPQQRRTSSPIDSRRKSSGNVAPSQHSARYYHDSPHDVPTLQTPPTSRHPLNHKVIKDERIGAYFQRSPSS